MSVQLGKLVSLILVQNFGETIRKVGDDLFTTFGKTINGILTTTGLTKKEIIHSLAVLVQYRLVKYKPTSNENFAEYSLLHDKVLLLLRYPRYVHLIQKKYDHTGALLVEELLKSGVEKASDTIIKAVSNSEFKDKSYLKEFRDCFGEMVSAHFLIRAPSPSADAVPALQITQSNVFDMQELSIKELYKLYDDNKEVPSDNEIYWMVNLDRFHQDFRDEIMVKAIERQIDVNASECFQFILQLMYSRTDPWVSVSNPISLIEIRQLCEKKSSNSELVRHVDQYVHVIENDATNFLQKIDDSNGGSYSIHMKNAFEELTWSVIENIITQRFGSKATRIFRVVRLRKFIEQEEIQKEAMVPAKEAKLYTYKLLEENFLQIQTIKKSGGPAKAFYLFHVNQYHIVSMLIEFCYKALYNSITRSMQDKENNRRLMEKSLRLEAIVEAMKERGETEEYIQEIQETLTPPEKDILEKAKTRIKILGSAEIGLDDTLFLFQLFLYYQTSTNRTSTDQAAQDKVDDG